jgi:hypothetical protein
MLLAVTGGAAYASAAVAAVAVVATVVMTVMTLGHQRALAEDERRAGQKADAYIRLLEHQHEDPGFRALLPPTVASRLLAFGSEETNAALGVVRAAGDDPSAFRKAIDALLAQIRLELRGTADTHPLDAVSHWQT